MVWWRLHCLLLSGVVFKGFLGMWCGVVEVTLLTIIRGGVQRVSRHVVWCGGGYIAGLH